MDVVLDGREEHLPSLPCVRALWNARFQNRHARLHRLRGHDELGQEKLATAEPLADFPDAGCETLFNGLKRIGSLIQGLLSESRNPLHVILDDCLLQARDIVLQRTDLLAVRVCRNQAVL